MEQFNTREVIQERSEEVGRRLGRKALLCVSRGLQAYTSTTESRYLSLDSHGHIMDSQAMRGYSSNVLDAAAIRSLTNPNKASGAHVFVYDKDLMKQFLLVRDTSDVMNSGFVNIVDSEGFTPIHAGEPSKQWCFMYEGDAPLEVIDQIAISPQELRAPAIVVPSEMRLSDVFKNAAAYAEVPEYGVLIVRHTNGEEKIYARRYIAEGLVEEQAACRECKLPWTAAEESAIDAALAAQAMAERCATIDAQRKLS